jgi:hypothetical protein
MTDGFWLVVVCCLRVNQLKVPTPLHVTRRAQDLFLLFFGGGEGGGSGSEWESKWEGERFFPQMTQTSADERAGSVGRECGWGVLVSRGGSSEVFVECCGKAENERRHRFASECK